MIIMLIIVMLMLVRGEVRLEAPDQLLDGEALAERPGLSLLIHK